MQIIPVFRVFDYDKTIEFYVNWLGCTINWEHRPEDAPFYMQVSLRGLPIELSEHHGECSPGGKFNIADFDDLKKYHADLLAKNYTYNRPGLEPLDWDPNTLEMTVIDPFSNRIGFTEKVKNFNSISPSALSLLYTKSHTDIPYISEVVKMIGGAPENLEKSPAFEARVAHFDIRYKSIDQLLVPSGIINILELSSGYSFRGLDLASRYAVHFIDTDLEEVITQKQKFLATLTVNRPTLKGVLHLTSLNALDEKRFNELVDSFPPGPVAVVNEGLLMYLNADEKQKLCAIIHRILQRKGGCWITADIYTPSQVDTKQFYSEQQLQFIAKHKIEENKFLSFEVARDFFNAAGFDIAAADDGIPAPLRFRATWMLKAK